MGAMRRRRFVQVVGGTVALGVVRTVRADEPELMKVSAGNNAVAAVLAAEGAGLVEVELDAALAATQIRIGDADPVEIAQRLRLKGADAARGRFLDDARNAMRVGSAIRDRLDESLTGKTDTLKANHRAWSRPFARKVLTWTRELEGSPIRGRKIGDEHGRIYLLEWAGATVDARGQRGPRGLAQLTEGPADPTLESYEQYLGTLVAAVV